MHTAITSLASSMGEDSVLYYITSPLLTVFPGSREWMVWQTIHTSPPSTSDRYSLVQHPLALPCKTPTPCSGMSNDSCLQSTQNYLTTCLCPKILVRAPALRCLLADVSNCSQTPRHPCPCDVSISHSCQITCLDMLVPLLSPWPVQRDSSKTRPASAVAVHGHSDLSVCVLALFSDPSCSPPPSLA